MTNQYKLKVLQSQAEELQVRVRTMENFVRLLNIASAQTPTTTPSGFELSWLAVVVYSDCETTLRLVQKVWFQLFNNGEFAVTRTNVDPDEHGYKFLYVLLGRSQIERTRQELRLEIYSNNAILFHYER